MNRWFRMYDEALDDPKVQRLDAEDFRAWVNLLCLANRNDGRLPPISDVAFALRRSPDDALTVVERLASAGLIDVRHGGSNGKHYAPHGWDKRQYKSDGSTERVKRFRQKNETLHETGPESDTDQTTEQTLPPPTEATLSKPEKKGFRLPKDWDPNVDDLRWCIEKQIPAEWRLRQTEMFKNHFWAAAGTNSRKLDWSRSWQNWLLRDLPVPGTGPPGTVEALAATRARMQAMDEAKCRSPTEPPQPLKSAIN